MFTSVYSTPDGDVDDSLAGNGGASAVELTRVAGVDGLSRAFVKVDGGWN